MTGIVDPVATDGTIRVGFIGPPDTEPWYASSGAAGADLRAALEEPLILLPGARALVPTGVRLQIPDGYEGQVRSRSGLAIRTGVVVLNAPGTIDSDYRGEIGVPLINLGTEPVEITHGMRIAQIVFTAVARATFDRAAPLDETQRGAAGFGSTGLT